MKFSPEKLVPQIVPQIGTTSGKYWGRGGGSPRGQSVAFRAPHFMIVKHSVSHNL